MKNNKKILGLIIGLMVLSVSIIGCNKNNEKITELDNQNKDSIIETIKENNYLTEDEFLEEELDNLDVIVKTTIDKDIYTIEDKLELTIDNVSKNYTLELSNPYKLEKSDGLTLTEIPLDLMFTMEMIILEPEKSFTQEISLESLEPGTYRISKNVSLIRNETKDGEPILISLEKDFHIE